MKPGAKDYLIIGGGLGGSFLAAQLAARGHHVHLADDTDPHAASRVAAGLFNVITGRFGALSWRAPELLAGLNDFFEHPLFSSLSKHLHFSPIYRPFKAVGEYNKWLNRIQESRFKPFASFQETPLLPSTLTNPHGGIMIQQCGWLEINDFLAALKIKLQQKGFITIYPETVNVSDLDLTSKRVKFSSGWLDFDELIFSTGYRSVSNELFPKIPIIPNKGETLLVHAPEWQLPFVLSRKVYVIPKQNHQYVVGATYRNQFTIKDPSKEGKEEILAHLGAALPPPKRILTHQAGIRPTTPDRKPILGTHSQHSFVHIFTGFGSKGVLYAPRFSNVMCEYLLGKTRNIPEEVHLNRFEK
ncbi:MAG: FAD-dependent oxidoreductase [Bacteroidota bacterium]